MHYALIITHYKLPFIFLISARRKITATTNETASLTSALQSIVTIFWLTAARIIEDGTKIITSRRRASKVDFPLFPIDCKIIDVDFIKQVIIIPLKKILTQSRAYSMYSGELPFPKIEITISGKNSKIRKTAVPIAAQDAEPPGQFPSRAQSFLLPY